MRFQSSAKGSELLHPFSSPPVSCLCQSQIAFQRPLIISLSSSPGLSRFRWSHQNCAHSGGASVEADPNMSNSSVQPKTRLMWKINPILRTFYKMMSTIGWTHSHWLYIVLVSLPIPSVWLQFWLLLMRRPSSLVLFHPQLSCICMLPLPKC